MAQPKFVRVDDAGKITTPGVVQQMTDIAKANGVPTGGTAGQVLQRSSTGAATWANTPSGLPAGGSSGQVVTRQADGTAAWATVQGAPGRGITSVVASTTDPTKATVTYTDGATETFALPSGAAGKSITSFGDPDGEGVSVVTFSDGTTTTITLPIGNVTQNLAWSKDAQAKVQGYWIVVSPTEPESGTYTTADGTVVPVVWQKPIEVLVPVIPEAPYFDKYALSIQVSDLVGVDYYLTGFTKDGATVDVPDVKIPDGGILKLADVSGVPALPYTVNMEARAEPGYKFPSSFTWAYSVADPNEVTVITSDAFTGALSGSIWNRTSDAALGGTPKFWGEHKFSQGATATEVMTLADEKLRIDPTKGRQVASLRDIGMNQRVEFDISFSEDAASPYFNIILASPGGKQHSHVFGGEANVAVRGGSAGKNFDVLARVGSTSATVGRIPGGGKFIIELLEKSLTVAAPGIAPVTLSGTRNLDPVNTAMVLECYPEHGGQKGLYYLDNIKVSRIGF